MGAALSWIAVHGSTKEAVLEKLDLVDTGRSYEFKRGRVSVAELPRGWVVLLAVDFEYASPERLIASSAGATAISFAVEEHVMASEARGYADGKEIWSIVHDPEEGGHYHLAVSGSLPPEFADVKVRLTQEQDEDGGEESDVDYIFDVPSELSKALCGYRPDEDPDDETPPSFTVVEPLRKAEAGDRTAVAPTSKPAGASGGFFANLFKKR